MWSVSLDCFVLFVVHHERHGKHFLDVMSHTGFTNLWSAEVRLTHDAHTHRHTHTLSVWFGWISHIYHRRDGGTSWSVLQISAISRMCLLSRWQNNVWRMPETVVSSTAGMLWLRSLQHPDWSLWPCRGPERLWRERSHMLATCSRVTVVSSSLFGCLFVSAGAAAICPQGHIKHSQSKEEERKENQNTANEIKQSQEKKILNLETFPL